MPIGIYQHYKGKLSPHYGRKHSEETKKKIGKKNKGKIPWIKGRHHPKEIKRKLSETNKGKHFSPATEFKKGHKINFGRKRPEWVRKKISEGQKGEKSHFWKGGKSFEPYSVDWTATLRRSIRERNYYTCQLCGRQQGDITFDVHHIDYDKKNCNPDNLITLCRSCNSKVNKNRKYWENYFNEKSK